MQHVAIVGIDGSGKTSTAVKLAARLCGELSLCKPGRPPIWAAGGEVRPVWAEEAAQMEALLRRADATGSRMAVVRSRRRYLRFVSAVERRMARRFAPEVMLVARCPRLDPAVYADFYLPRLARLLPLELRLRGAGWLARVPRRQLYLHLDTPVEVAVARIHGRLEQLNAAADSGRQHWLHLHETAEVLGRLAEQMRRAVAWVARQSGARLVTVDNRTMRQDGVVELCAEQVRALCLGRRSVTVPAGAPLRWQQLGPGEAAELAAGAPGRHPPGEAATATPGQPLSHGDSGQSDRRGPISGSTRGGGRLARHGSSASGRFSATPGQDAAADPTKSPPGALGPDSLAEERLWLPRRGEDGLSYRVLERPGPAAGETRLSGAVPLYGVPVRQVTRVHSPQPRPGRGAWFLVSLLGPEGSEVRLLQLFPPGAAERWAKGARPGLAAETWLVAGAGAAGAWSAAEEPEQDLALVVYAEPSRTELWALVLDPRARIHTPPFPLAPAEDEHLFCDRAGQSQITVTPASTAGTWQVTAHQLGPTAEPSPTTTCTVSQDGAVTPG